MGRYEICVFDLDGTLTDPKEGIVHSYQHALSAFGIREEPENLVKFIGPPLRNVFGGHYGFSESDAEKAVKQFREYFQDAGFLENVLYPGIPEGLQRLKDGGMTLAVATNKITADARRILEHFGIDGFFSAVSGDRPDGSLSKDGKREIIRIALDALGPERGKAAVMIGDREIDIIGAEKAGIDSIGVTWGYGSIEELQKAGAKMIAGSVDEACRLVMGEEI